jgi:hypothetical protein
MFAAAGGPMVGVAGRRFHDRLRLTAPVDDEGAPGMKPAAVGRVHGVGHISGEEQRRFPPADFGRRNAGEQGMGVGMPREAESVALSATSTILPRYITATRWLMYLTTSRWWVNVIVFFNFR